MRGRHCTSPRALIDQHCTVRADEFTTELLVYTVVAKDLLFFRIVNICIPRIHIQYWNWMVGKEDSDTGEIEGGVLRGDLGWSKTGKSPVSEVIGRRLPATAELALWSAVPLIGLAVWMGIQAAFTNPSMKQKNSSWRASLDSGPSAGPRIP